MNGDTQIYVSGREYKVDSPVVTYEQIVEIWNELHESEGKHIIGTPGIDYENDLKGEGRGSPAGQGRCSQGRHELFGRPRACLLRTCLTAFAEDRSGLTVTDRTATSSGPSRRFLVSLQVTGLLALAPLRSRTTPQE